MRDEGLRSSCFAALDVLGAQFGEEIPYRGGLDRGFAYRGRRVPFLSPQKGIYRAAAQEGPAALSINIGPLDEREPAPVDDPLERRYGVREARVRLHQARFRGRVLVAYSHKCTICRLKTFHEQTIELPGKRAWRPDPDRLAQRFERFELASR